MPTWKKRSGFTLVEVMICVVLLGLSSAAIMNVHASGLQTQSAQWDAEIIDSILRSRMSLLLSTNFDLLVSGNENIVFDGKTYSVSWVVTELLATDLLLSAVGGTVFELKQTALDAVIEFEAKGGRYSVSAKKIILTVQDAEIWTIVTDNDGRLLKI